LHFTTPLNFHAWRYSNKNKNTLSGQYKQKKKKGKKEELKFGSQTDLAKNTKHFFSAKKQRKQQ
jgi:hypothetical protein